MSELNNQSFCGMRYTIDELRGIISPIARRWDVVRMWLFGSQARGEATIDSDIDIRVDPEPSSGYFQLAGLWIDLEEALGMEVDLQSSGCFSEEFLASIAKDEILIYEQQS